MGKATNRSALFLDMAYIDQKFVELRSDIMATLDAKFRMVQDRENKIISMLGGAQTQEKRAVKAPVEKQPSVSEEINWKMDMRRRVDKMVKEYPELYADFNTVLRRVYGKMRDVYGFVSEQAIKDGTINYIDGSPRTLTVPGCCYVRFNPDREEDRDDGK